MSRAVFISENNEPFEVDSKYYMYTRKPLGLGAYGTVCAFKDQTNGEEVAIKKCGNLFENLTDTKRILRELKLLRNLKHDNVIKLREVLLPQDKNKFEEIYIVMDKMGTNLRQVIKSNQTITDGHCQFFMYQVMRALKYIHSTDVLHRDLKPSNLLVNADCTLKICDFGLSRSVSPVANDALTTLVVTKWYRAPELLLESDHYDGKVDVWSAGCILAELIGRRPIFVGDDSGDETIQQLKVITDVLGTPTMDDIKNLGTAHSRKYILKMQAKEKIPWKRLFPHANTKALDLLEKMLQFDPAKRITVTQTLEHPYFAEYHDADDEPVSNVKISFDFESTPLTKDSLRDMIYLEILNHHPEDAQKQGIQVDPRK